METVFWGGALRVLQALMQAAPTLIAGLFVAGVFRRFLGPQQTVRLFGGNSWRALPQSWALGMLLPVCALGVIPVIREMRRAGVSGGAILAFALSAPLFNPLSLLYGLTLSQPLHIVAFACCSLLVVTVIGVLWDRFFPDVGQAEPPPAPAEYGLKRLIAVGVVGAREVAGPTAGYWLIGLAGVALLNAALPFGSLQTSMNHDNPSAPLLMAAAAVPAYVTPMMAMSQLGSMFQHGNSVGAAFVLLALGAGTNLAVVAFMGRSYGVRKSLFWLTSTVAVVVGLAYAVDKPLFPRNSQPEGHTHVFDVYCCPYFTAPDAPAQAILETLREGALPHEVLSLALLGVFLLTGLALRAFDRRWRIEDWLESAKCQVAAAPQWYDRALPGAAIGAAALCGLVVVSVIGCFVYYPAPGETFDEMQIVKTEALSAAITGERELAEHWLELWDDCTRKLQVGVYLRKGRLTKEQQAEALQLRQKLELLEHALDGNDRDDVRQRIAGIERTYERVRDAYLRTP